MEKRHSLLIFLCIAVSFAFAAECIECEKAQTMSITKMMVIGNENTFTLDIYVVNGSDPSDPYSDSPILIYIYNKDNSFLKKVFTNKEGKAVFSFAEYKDICYNYKIMFCSCDNDKLKDCCLKLNSMDVSSISYDSILDVPLADSSGYVPTTPKYNINSMPATEEYSYCKPPIASSIPAFCLPLALIFALLGSALMMSGRNPLSGFDFSGTKVGKHIKYDSRGRGAGFTAFQAVSTGMSVARGIRDYRNPTTLADKFAQQVTKPLTKISQAANAVGEMGKETISGPLTRPGQAANAVAKMGKEDSAISMVKHIPLVGRAVGMAVASAKEMPASAVKAVKQTLDTSIGYFTQGFATKSGAGTGTEMTIESGGKQKIVVIGGGAFGELVTSILGERAGAAYESKMNDWTTTKTDIKVALIAAQDALAVMQQAKEKAVEKRGNLEFTSEGGGSGRVIKLQKDEKGNETITYKDEDGKIKVAGLTGTIGDDRTFNQLKQEMAEQGNIIGGYIVKDGTNAYIVRADEKGNAVVYHLTKEGRSEAADEGTSGKILSAYNSLPTKIGDKSGTLAAYNAAAQDYGQALNAWKNTVYAYYGYDEKGAGFERKDAANKVLAGFPESGYSAEETKNKIKEFDERLANPDLPAADRTALEEQKTKIEMGYAVSAIPLLENAVTASLLTPDSKGKLNDDQKALEKTDAKLEYVHAPEKEKELREQRAELQMGIIEERIEKINERLGKGVKSPEEADKLLAQRDELVLFKQYTQTAKDSPDDRVVLLGFADQYLHKKADEYVAGRAAMVDKAYDGAVESQIMESGLKGAPEEGLAREALARQLAAAREQDKEKVIASAQKEIRGELPVYTSDAPDNSTFQFKAAASETDSSKVGKVEVDGVFGHYSDKHFEIKLEGKEGGNKEYVVYERDDKNKFTKADVESSAMVMAAYGAGGAATPNNVIIGESLGIAPKEYTTDSGIGGMKVTFSAAASETDPIKVGAIDAAIEGGKYEGRKVVIMENADAKKGEDKFEVYERNANGNLEKAPKELSAVTISAYASVPPPDNITLGQESPHLAGDTLKIADSISNTRKAVGVDQTGQEKYLDMLSDARTVEDPKRAREMIAAHDAFMKELGMEFETVEKQLSLGMFIRPSTSEKTAESATEQGTELEALEERRQKLRSAHNDADNVIGEYTCEFFHRKDLMESAKGVQEREGLKKQFETPKMKKMREDAGIGGKGSV